MGEDDATRRTVGGDRGELYTKVTPLGEDKRPRDVISPNTRLASLQRIPPPGSPDPEKRHREDPKIAAELERRRTPEAKAEVVYPLLRRAVVTLNKTVIETEPVLRRCSRKDRVSIGGLSGGSNSIKRVVTSREKTGEREVMSSANPARSVKRRPKARSHSPSGPERRDATQWSDVLRLQRMAGNRATGELLGPSRQEGVPESVQSVVGSESGAALDPATRGFMESRFDHDFSDVRVHTDDKAAASATDVNADAYTVGRDVVFGRGQYAPHSPSGRKVLAHELAHVVQQRGRTGAPAGIEPENAPLEHDAQQTADAVTSSAGVAGGQRSAARGVQRSSAPVLCRQVAAGTLNFDNLAARVHKGVAGLGTDEEGVYLALQQLQKDQAAIDALKAKYEEKYDESLVADIRDDFSGEELEYALQLLNMGDAGSKQAIGKLPTTPAEYEAAARRIWRAVEGIGTDEEAIFAVLLPFKRDHMLLARLTTAYLKISNGELLSTRLDEELSGSECDYAHYLMGGPAIQANPELQEVSLAEATQLFKELSGSSFLTSTGGNAPVPFSCPINGCFDRAYVMTQILTEKGIASQKVFAVSRVSAPFGPARSGLRVETPTAADVAPGGTPAVEWWYHVAPVIRVRQPQGGVVEMVMDPSMAAGPITIQQWTGLMSKSQFARLTLDDIQALLRADPHGQYPVDKPLVFTTERNMYYPPTAQGSPGPREAYQSHVAARPTMTGYSELAVIHQLAAQIRTELAKTPIDVDRIVQIVTASPRAARHKLWLKFPNLRVDLHTAVTNAAEVTRIEDALSAP